MDKTLPRDIRLDFAKAIAIALILFWHLQPIKLLVTDQSTTLIRILKIGLNWFNFQITLIAVPVFLIVSLYLFHQKMEASRLNYLNKRCRRLVEVFIFWTGCQFACFYGISLIGPKTYRPLFIPVHRLLMEGGPTLPIVGGSVFYFLFVLLILTLVSYAFRYAGRIISLLGITVIIISLLYFEILNLNGYGVSYWRIDNFLIYIPISYFLWKYETEKLSKFIPLLYICFIFFSIQDFFLRKQGYDLAAWNYSRVSIVCGSVALFTSLLQSKSLYKVPLISFLSNYSLGIFAVHKYWNLFVIVIFKMSGSSNPLYITDYPIDLWVLTTAMITISLTFLSVYLGGRTCINRFLI